MRRSLLWTALFGTVIVVTGCGGGGGGGGGGGSPYNSPNPYLRTEVPYSTPVKVATVDPLVNVVNTGYKSAVADTFIADITTTGSHTDVIIAGRMTQETSVAEWGNNKIHMLSWNGSTLVDRTAQWFPGGINEIVGTEPSVKFADFFKTGRTDMFVAPSTDMQHFGPAYVFTNNGSNFSRQSITLNNVWAHDSAIADLNNDTYKDIIVTDYGPNSTMIMNNRVNGFTTYTDSRGTGGDLRWGGSSVAVADFLQNGGQQLIFTDTACAGSALGRGCSASALNKLYTYTLNPATNDVTYTWHSDLPTARFDLPKYSGVATGGSHNVRAVAHDFNDDNIQDAIIFSRPSNGNLKLSEIQFLKNNGGGSFVDVTDSTLVGYNTNTSVTYNPKFVDLNGDGKTDILVSGTDFSGANNSNQFLLKSSDGKYVAAYQNILTDLVKQSNSLQNTDNSGNTVNIFKAPNGKLFLVTTVSFMNGTDRQLAIYMSELGSQSTITAQTAVNLVLQKWPYMTVPQVNEMLAKTSATYFNGRVLDLEALMNPIGELGLPTVRGVQPIRGWISGVNLDSSQAVVLDSMNRSFIMNLQPMNISRLNAFQLNMQHNDQHTLTSHAEYLVNGPVMTYGNVRVGSEDRNNFATGQNGQGPTAVTAPLTNYTVGVPNVYRKGNWTYGAQYTALNQNPWLSMGGAWGTVNNSAILDNVVTYRHQNGFSAQASVMHVTTNIQPGLVTNVSNMIGGWAETGYRYTDHKNFGDLGLYAGVKPMLFSGNVTAKIPTSVDNTGNVVYTNKKMAVQSSTTTYIRAMYTNIIDKRTQYRISGMVLDNGQYRIMNEFRWWLQ
jgi:hypothetical protein